MASSGETPDLVLEIGATASEHFLPFAAKLGLPLVSLGGQRVSMKRKPTSRFLNVSVFNYIKLYELLQTINTTECNFFMLYSRFLLLAPTGTILPQKKEII